ncbi:hypothetical protein DRQ33_05115 [bacterium]|nr:MAG: hypothetical protein DRQ33_05115 [bacterium]
MYLLVLFGILLTGTLFAQGCRVLVDDAPFNRRFCSGGHHTDSTYQVFWDSLNARGTDVDFTTSTGRFPADLNDYDFLILMHHRTSCPNSGFNYSQRGQIIDYFCQGGIILIWPICWDDIDPFDNLLNDPRWITGLSFSYGCVYCASSGSPMRTTNIDSFPPFTDGVDTLYFQVAHEIYITPTPPPSPVVVPFVWSECDSQIWAVVSYPQRIDGGACDYSRNGRIFAIADNHTFEYPTVVSTYYEDNFRFMMNIIFSLSCGGDTISPPPTPIIDTLDTAYCADAGEVIDIYGHNFDASMTAYFDSSIISVFIIDSTHIQFVIPSVMPAGLYDFYIVSSSGVESNHIWIRVPCEDEEPDIVRFSIHCGSPGDTVWFYGENFDLSAQILFDGSSLPVSQYEIISDTSGWFIIQGTVIEGIHWVTVRNSPTQEDSRAILVPCTCVPLAPETVWVENVRFYEQTDGSDTVYISYDLFGTGTSYDIVISASSDGGSTWTVPCVSFVPPAPINFVGVSPGTHELVWLAGNDFPDFEGTNFVFRIQVADAGGGSSGAGVLDWVIDINGPNEDYGYSITPTSDGGYAIAGGTNSFGVGSYDMLLVKLVPTDSVDAIEWSKAIGGVSDEYARSIVQTSDGGYVVAGVTKSFGAGIEDFFILKLTSSGSVVWSRTIGGTNYDEGYSVVQTSDGGYIIAGLTKSFGVGNDDLFIVKLNQIGSVEWSKTLGEVSFSWGSYSIIQTSDDGYAITGLTNSLGAGDWDLFLVKLDSTGIVEWSKTVGGIDYDDGYSVVQTYDGGYIVTGRTYNFGASNSDLFLVKFNSSGSVEWSKVVGGTFDDYGKSVIQTSDGGYAVAGETYSFGAGFNDLFLVKFDSIGSVELSRTAGGTDMDCGYSIAQTLDGGYVVVGETWNIDPMGDLFIVKFEKDSNSCMGTFCSPTITDVSPTIISLSPTVTSPSPTISSPSPTVTVISPSDTIICFTPCPFGDIYCESWSDPGPIDTREPRLSITCPPDGNVGDLVTVTWNYLDCDSFVIPYVLGPYYQVQIWFSADGDSFELYARSAPNTGNWSFYYPNINTDNGYIAICITDSFGHTSCDTCGTFSIDGDTTRPKAYIYGDTCINFCGSDSVFIVMKDSTLDLASLFILAPDGPHSYPDPNLHYLGGDTLWSFVLPELLYMSPGPYTIALSVCDSFGNCILDIEFVFWVCCNPLEVWLECPSEGWNAWTSCPDQSVMFGIRDTVCQEVDTTRVFVRRSINAAESDVPQDSLIFWHSGDTLWVIIPGDYSDLDSVWIIMDSLFPVPGCQTEP